MVRESRIIAGLILESVTDEEWNKSIIEENILQKRTIASAKRNAHTVKKRLLSLSIDYIRLLIDGDDELATQIVLVSVLKTNPLLVEFFFSVLEDAYNSHVDKLFFHDWNDFLEEKRQTIPEIRNWAESSKDKMGQIVFRILFEAGFINNPKKKELQPFLPRPEICILLERDKSDNILKGLKISQ